MSRRANFFVITALLSIASTALAADLPVDGKLLSETEQCFAMVRSTPDGEMRIGDTWQSVTATEVDGKPAWKVVVHQRGMNGSFDMRDEFLLWQMDLRPISLESVAKRGGETVHEVNLNYSENSAIGEKRMPGGDALKINESFDGPVWDGNLWGLTFAALPLEQGMHYEIPAFQYDKGQGSFVVDVIGTDTVAVNGEAVEVFVVKGGMKDTSQTEYLIRQSPRAEIGYRGQGFSQTLGGDCDGMH